MLNAPYQFVFHRRQVNSGDIAGFMQLLAGYCGAERRSPTSRCVPSHEMMYVFACKLVWLPPITD